MADMIIDWLKPIDLLKGAPIFTCDLEEIPDKPGVYVFAREFGANVIPLYIGQAQNLKKRITGQFNNAKLMKGIEASSKGRRLLFMATLNSKKMEHKKQLNIIEKALIEYSLTEGHFLLNEKGTKTPVHTISANGKKGYHKPFPRKMIVKQK